MAKRKNSGGSVTFTQESWDLMKDFQETMGFGTVSAMVQAAVVEYITHHHATFKEMKK